MTSIYELDPYSANQKMYFLRHGFRKLWYYRQTVMFVQTGAFFTAVLSSRISRVGRVSRVTVTAYCYR